MVRQPPTLASSGFLLSPIWYSLLVSGVSVVFLIVYNLLTLRAELCFLNCLRESKLSVRTFALRNEFCVSPCLVMNVAFSVKK